MPHTILVVDDSPIARKMLIRVLPPSWDVQLIEAASGIEAMAACRSHKIDLMFLDLTMPDMDGYHVLEAMNKEAIKLPVIVVSADIQPRARDRVMAAGAIAFIKKPIDISKLEEVVKLHRIFG